MFKTEFIDEPDLEFAGGGRHIDIRFGIMNHCVLDRDSAGGHREIKIGVIGTAEPIEQFLKWLEESGGGVDAKTSKKPNLFPRFPGFGPDSCSRASWACDNRARRQIGLDAISSLRSLNKPGEIVKKAAAIYTNEVEYLVTEVKPDVIFCVLPDLLLDELDRAAEAGTPRSSRNDDSDTSVVEDYRHDFHHCLKAEAMRFFTPLQLVLPSTFGAGSRGKSTKKKRPARKDKARPLQDPATRAWNLFTAMYYKAGGTPWRLPRENTDYATCYVGISFYYSLDQKSVLTSIAQVFNERGEGIVVRGGQARLSKEDRSPHLSETDAAAILVQALQRYRAEHKTLPARVVLHKSSYFDVEERAGFRAALRQERVELADLISIRPSSIRLFRMGRYPTLRGTHMPLDGPTHLLYTRGSVPFFETYPGMYAPRALEVRFDDAEQGRGMLCREILSLTKMNWNATQFDMRDPITLRAADQVGNILKYVPLDTPAAQIARRYSFYM